MGRTTRTTVACATALGLAALLSSCASAQPFAIFDREPQASDALPDAVSDEFIDVDTARFVGDDDGTRLWLVRPSEHEDGICLVAYQSDEVWLSGCSDRGTRVGIGGEVGSYEVVQDGWPAPEGTEKVFDNVFAPKG
jgi:hypothetical protein